MHIVILGPREPVPPIRGGAIEKLTFNLARYLVKAGHKVTLFATNEVLGSKNIEGVEIHYIAPPIPGSRFYAKEMPQVSRTMYKLVRRILEANEGKEEIVLHSVYFYNLMNFPRTFLREFPTIVTEFEHYPWIREYLYHYPFISTINRIRWELDVAIRVAIAKTILPFVTSITFVSRYQRDSALKFIGFPRSRTCIIPNAVDTDIYKPVEDSELRERLAEGSDLVLLFVGRLTPHKNLHTLLKTLGHIPYAKRRKIKLIVVGPKGPGFTLRESMPKTTIEYLKFLNLLIEKYDLKENIRFLGQVEESKMPYIYSSSDALAHPSLVEAFGLVIIEAGACGKPSVVFDVPPFNEIIINMKTGILVKKINSKALAETIEYLIDAPLALKKMGLEAMNWTQKYFSWNNIIRCYIKVYKEIL